MAGDKLDMEKVKDFLGKQLKDVTEATKVKFRALNKALKSEFGSGLFIPRLSAVVRSLRPDLAKPAKKAGTRRRRGAKPGPKPGRRPGRPAGGSGAFLLKVGRKLSLVKSRDGVQSAIDKMVAAGQSLGRLKVYALSHVGITTKVTIE
jgi:hypothetical protein